MLHHCEDLLFHRLVLSKSGTELERPALRLGDTQVSYAQLRDCVNAVTQRMEERGIRLGDRVVIVSPNSIEYVIAYLGITSLGSIVVPIDPHAGEDRMRMMFRETSPALVLLHGVPASPLMADYPSETITLDPATLEVHIDDDDQAAKKEGKDNSAGPDGDTPAALMFSAGSTGRPKGVLLTHNMFLHIAETLSAIIGMNPDHRELSLSPMTHSGGWQRVTSTLLTGGCVFIYQGPLSVPGVLQQIHDYAINGFFTTPPLIRFLLKSAPKKIAQKAQSLRSIEIASAPLSAAELKSLLERFPGANVFFQYGLTECSRALILDSRGHPDKLDTVGLPTAGVEVAIVDETGTHLGVDQEGEILLRAPQIAQGYWKQPELTAKRFQDGWFHTGDFGRVDSDGFVSYCGRRDDQINCGGLSFFPGEVEAIIGPREDIKQYLIAGVKDPSAILSQVPWAFVVPVNPKSWSSETFLARARGLLPPPMVPRKVVVVSELPQTSTGKLNRRRTVEQYASKDARNDT